MVIAALLAPAPAMNLHSMPRVPFIQGGRQYLRHGAHPSAGASSLWPLPSPLLPSLTGRCPRRVCAPASRRPTWTRCTLILSRATGSSVLSTLAWLPAVPGAASMPAVTVGGVLVPCSCVRWVPPNLQGTARQGKARQGLCHLTAAGARANHAPVLVARSICTCAVLPCGAHPTD